MYNKNKDPHLDSENSAGVSRFNNVQRTKPEQR